MNRVVHHPFFRRWPRRPWIIAHRGASGLVPENTLTAFVLAAEQGADFVELDLRITRDGHLVVCHDATLERTTDGRGFVHEHTLAELQRLDAGYAFTLDRGVTYPFRGLGLRIPSFEEVIAALPSHIGIDAEVKSAPWDPADRRRGQAIAERLVALVRARPELRERLLISSFDTAVLDTVRARDPELPVGLCTIPLAPLPEQLRSTIECGYDAFHPMDVGFDEHGAAVVASAYLAGLVVNVWTVDAPDRAVELAALGVDGIITDYPEATRQAIERALNRQRPTGLATTR
ncbi:glycerophosphodiester phosphodiesterase family protein [Thermomicrobium sp. 4228-Ro]|uniref:glycerophosphodiester phosphodiesterase n=1 Tax=Thermomicrobium sp. 4228-Ro TaxID=2993937 RepID=UPI0022498F0C|nr:glycerophosphodiester phosphodiesterase family protein [Thermomicrobium sp. 4228-Ro]MCX2728265.1 glycerophosphodiester phosphodiesterase family protein [Thermomicrobium sp. 4228-Ro]